MEAERMQREQAPSRVFQQKKNEPALQLADNRPQSASQADLITTLQRSTEDEDLLQGKFVTQRDIGDEEDLLQGKFTAQREPDYEDELLQGKFVAQRTENNETGMPDGVKQQMEDSFSTDFSSVRVHPDSSSAPEVGALAYTQGTDIHFAPGQFKPDTSTGQQLLGHELAHVLQQQAGRVQPTTEVAGMAVNDDVSLEHEADLLGAKAVL